MRRQTAIMPRRMGGCAPPSLRLSADRRRDEARREFAPLLETAVRDRLISDVPLGALLSGGIDSTLVVALILRNRPQLSTFSIGFSQSSYDETRWSRLAAAELRTQHHEELARCDSPDLLLHVARHQDEPFADSARSCPRTCSAAWRAST